MMNPRNNLTESDIAILNGETVEPNDGRVAPLDGSSAPGGLAASGLLAPVREFLSASTARRRPARRMPWRSWRWGRTTSGSRSCVLTW